MCLLFAHLFELNITEHLSFAFLIVVCYFMKKYELKLIEKLILWKLYDFVLLKVLVSPNNFTLWLLQHTKFLSLSSIPFLISAEVTCFDLFLTSSVKTFYGVSLISWKKWIWNDSLNLLKFVIWFQKQISCFVEYKNDKERKMAKGKSWVEINCKQRIKKQLAIKLENLRGTLTAV